VESLLKLKKRFKYTFYSLLSNVLITICLGQISVNSYHANGFDKIPKSDCFELGIKLPSDIQQQINNFSQTNNGLNPYDPGQVEVTATYTCQRSDRIFKRNGFYYEDYTVANDNWQPKESDYKYRVRFAPPDEGFYLGKISLFVSHILTSSVEFTFSVAGSTNPGNLILAHGNLRKLQHENGDIFFGIGQNIGYVVDAQALEISRPNTCLQWYCRPPGSYDVYRGYINDIAENKGNFVRLRLDAFDFPIEWPEWKMFSTDPEPSKTLLQCLNNYNHNQKFMWEFDKVVALCEERGIYMMLNILGDGSWSTIATPGDGEDFAWKRNPYSALLGSDLGNLKRFFSDPTAKDYYKKFLYYIHSRWGYSSSMGIWELINETEKLEGFQEDNVYAEKVNEWICEMKSYLESMYPWHPVTNGSIQGNSQPDCLNIWSKNSYNISITNCKYDNGNYNQRAKGQYVFNDQYRPFIWGELGTDDIVDANNDREFHNALWSTTMMGGVTTGLYWWDFRQKYGVNHRRNFNSLSEFCKRIDWKEVLTAGKDFSEGDVFCRSKKEKKKIFSFWQRNNAANFAFGWAVNASSVWYSDPDEYATPTGFQEASAHFDCVPTANPYNIASNPCHPQIHVNDLLPLTKYDIEIYDTYDVSNKLLEQLTESTDILGNLKFRRQLPFNIEDPFYPDYAFIVRTHDSNRNRIRIYPNPANVTVSFELTDENVTEFTVKIYSELGQLVFIQKNNKNIAVDQLSDGFYILEVSYDNKYKTGKLIIQH